MLSFPGRNGRTMLTIPTNLLFDTFRCLQYELLAYSDIKNQVHWIFPPNAIARSPHNAPKYKSRTRNIRIQNELLPEPPLLSFFMYTHTNQSFDCFLVFCIEELL